MRMAGAGGKQEHGDPCGPAGSGAVGRRCTPGRRAGACCRRPASRSLPRLRRRIDSDSRARHRPDRSSGPRPVGRTRVLRGRWHRTHPSAPSLSSRAGGPVDRIRCGRHRRIRRESTASVIRAGLRNTCENERSTVHVLAVADLENDDNERVCAHAVELRDGARCGSGRRRPGRRACGSGEGEGLRRAPAGRGQPASGRRPGASSTGARPCGRGGRYMLSSRSSSATTSPRDRVGSFRSCLTSSISSSSSRRSTSASRTKSLTMTRCRRQ